jgi:hypothetical protein
MAHCCLRIKFCSEFCYGDSTRIFR